jgi:hypothetical protein
VEIIGNRGTEEQSERGTDAPQPLPPPTLEQFAAYQRAWAYFNEALFDRRLKPCLLNLSRHRGSEGFFAAKRWQKGDEMIHEISLNPDLLRSPPHESLGTLVHEMVHQWQEDHGTPSRANYHNTEWADKMEEIGLIPSSTGEPGGKRTGQSMSHYIDAEGCFARALREMPGDGLLPLPTAGLFPNAPSRPSDTMKGTENGHPRFPGGRAPTRRSSMEFVRTMFLPNPHDAFKDPGWRWRRCRYLLQRRRRPVSDLDDDATREVWLFRRALAGCRDDADRERLALDFPALAGAHRVFTGGPLQRAELEARLLADQTDDAIAVKCGIPAAAVGAYHATFFEVRPCLDAHAYTFNVAIGPKAHYGLTPEDRDVLLKLVGYGMGGPGVDALLAYFAEPPAVPASLEALDDAALGRLRSGLGMHALVQSLTLSVDALGPAKALEAFHWLRAGNSSPTGGPDSPAPIHAAMPPPSCVPAGGVATPDVAAAGVAGAAVAGSLESLTPPPPPATRPAAAPTVAPGRPARRRPDAAPAGRPEPELVPA